MTATTDYQVVFGALVRLSGNIRRRKWRAAYWSADALDQIFGREPRPCSVTWFRERMAPENDSAAAA